MFSSVHLIIPRQADVFVKCISKSALVGSILSAFWPADRGLSLKHSRGSRLETRPGCVVCWCIDCGPFYS